MFNYLYSLFVQCEKWAENPDQFVEDEDEDSFTYSVRISSQDLLMVSASKITKCIKNRRYINKKPMDLRK